MTIATVQHHRPSLPALNMFIAVAAVVISVFALVIAPAEVSRSSRNRRPPTWARGPGDIPSNLVPAPRTEWIRTGTPLLEGCEQSTFQRCCHLVGGSQLPHSSSTTTQARMRLG
jgi:hypothetical protein